MLTSGWIIDNFPVLEGLLYSICYMVMILLACVIEGLMARTIFQNKKKVWVVVITTAITNLIANSYMNAGYASSAAALDPSISETDAVSLGEPMTPKSLWVAFNSAFADTPLGAFLKLLAIIAIVETIVIIVEWLVYKFMHACKHSFLFSLDANITSFSFWELIQLILLSPTTAFGNPISIFRLDANMIVFAHDWTSFFSRAETVPFLRVSMLVCAALVGMGIALMFVLQMLEKKAAEQKTRLSN